MNRLRFIESDISGSKIQLGLGDNTVQVAYSGTVIELPTVLLYRPSQEEILNTSNEDNILILRGLSERASKAAQQVNHIELPSGSYRLTVPGIAIRGESRERSTDSRQIRLQGRSGTIVEKLLLEKSREWSVRELAEELKMAPSLVHRVLDRLEKEEFLRAVGRGKNKLRFVDKSVALAERWSQEEKPPKSMHKAYLYGTDPEQMMEKLRRITPQLALGGVHAANKYKPTLTRINSPMRVWVPFALPLHELSDHGISLVPDGSNLLLMQTAGDPWSSCMDIQSMTVSKWRAWQEIASSEGRTQELSDMLLRELTL